jgi:hypothetical protein
METLRLKTVLTLVLEDYPDTNLKWCEERDVQFMVGSLARYFMWKVGADYSNSVYLETRYATETSYWHYEAKLTDQGTIR